MFVPKPTREIAFLFVVMSLSACASIVEGTDQSITVSLTPEKATCIVTRKGTQLGSLSQKNKIIKVSKSKNDLEIECQAPGHIAENLTVESSASGWGVVGCILIDLCITDSATGALNKYPEQIAIALIQQNFKSKQERDGWFENRRTSIEKSWDRRIEKQKLQCEDAADKEGCGEELSEIRKRKTKALERLERQRALTKITPSKPTPSSIQSRLKAAKDLYDGGLISREEYDAKRKEIMSGL